MQLAVGLVLRDGHRLFASVFGNKLEVSKDTPAEKTNLVERLIWGSSQDYAISCYVTTVSGLTLYSTFSIILQPIRDGSPLDHVHHESLL